MARLGRYFVPDQPLHVIQRGNNRGAVFLDDNDFTHYRDWLTAAADEHGVSIHAYVLMTNHVHLLATPSTAESLPAAMQSIGRRYVRYVNARYERTGTLWEGRYRAAPIDSDEYFVTCCRYIELNPVRAGMVEHPRQYRWSSYRAHAEGRQDVLAAYHPVWRRLGRSIEEQQATYRALIREALDPAFVEALRQATNGGWALGGEGFSRAIAKAAHRRARRLPRGPKPVAHERQIKLL